MIEILHEDRLNEFLVEVFNDILRLEEASLAKGEHKNLSVNEMHVLEAADKCKTDGEAPGMAEIAAKLSVSPGTLTVAVKTLEQKGYLIRERGEKDKRRVCVKLTAKSVSPLKSHAHFHEQLVKHAADALSENELSALAHALGSLHRFFKSYNPPQCGA